VYERSVTYDGAFATMVKAYNELHPKQQVTEAQFAGLMKKGQILANEILPEFAKQLKNATGGEAGAQISTLNKEINKLSNEWVLFVRSLNSGKNELGGFFSWFIGEARFALKWWREFFDEYNVSWKNILLPTMLLEKDMYRQREKQLNGIFETNKKTSQASLKYMTDEIQKQKYITDGLKTHNAEIKKLQEEYKKAKEINKAINVMGRYDRGFYSAEKKEQFEQFKTNKARMSEIAEQISARKGLIAGLTIANKTSSEEEIKGDEKVKKSKKEKIDLTFKEIDSLYQLRKAQAEARINQSADDESKTFQERLILLKEHTNAKISENELYYDHETALALKQYHDDLKRNNDAFREKGINATEHAENIKDINSTLNNTLT
jgi:hypothetical protein